MRVFAAAASLVALACASAPRLPESLSQADNAAIRQTLTALGTAGATGHYRELGRFFTEDAVLMPQERPAVVGRPQVQAWFTVGAKDWQHRVLETVGAGDLAYVRAAFSLNLDFPGSVPMTGKVLAILRRQTDRSWLIARYAFSCDTTC